jgi:hypothetical protein
MSISDDLLKKPFGKATAENSTNYINGAFQLRKSSNWEIFQHAMVWIPAVL